MIFPSHCTQDIFKTQIAQAVKEFAWLPIPFANCDPLQLNDLGRIWARLVELFSDTFNRVLHEFSLAVLEVRKVGTSK